MSDSPRKAVVAVVTWSGSARPRIRLHDLRHGWATMALSAGVHPKVVQERLGHSSITVTLDVSATSPRVDTRTPRTWSGGLIAGEAR